MSAAVVFTMVQSHDGEPIEAQKSVISRIEARRVPTFSTTIRDSKSVYGPAPEHGVPVILGGTVSGRDFGSLYGPLVRERYRADLTSGEFPGGDFNQGIGAERSLLCSGAKCSGSERSRAASAVSTSARSRWAAIRSR